MVIFTAYISFQVLVVNNLYQPGDLSFKLKLLLFQLGGIYNVTEKSIWSQVYRGLNKIINLWRII